VKQDTEFIQSYNTGGHLRMVRFVQANGERISLNYAYMVSVRYAPSAGIIEVGFTSHHITLRGNNLEPLFHGIEAQQVQSISCIDERYKEIAGNAEPTVLEITVTGTMI